MFHYALHYALHRYSRMLNYLLSYIVFQEWKCGAIRTHLKGWASIARDLFFFLSLVQEFPFWQVILCLCHRYSRMLNHLLSYIVFYEWKSGAIWKIWNDNYLSIHIYSTCYLFYKSFHFGHFGMAFYVSCHRYSRMRNHVLNHIVFCAWKYGAIRRILK